MASMSIEDMREVVESAYVSSNWVRKVRRMPDGQVVAIYYAMLVKARKNASERVTEPSEKQVDILKENQLSFL